MNSGARHLARAHNCVQQFRSRMHYERLPIRLFSQLHYETSFRPTKARLLVNWFIFVGPLPRVRPRNGILALLVLVLVLVVPLRSESIGEL